MTSAPGSTRTRTTDPGIGATSEPAAGPASGSVNRGSSTYAVQPAAESTSTASLSIATSQRLRTPSTVRSTSSGVAEWSVTSTSEPSATTDTEPDRPKRYDTVIDSPPGGRSDTCCRCEGLLRQPLGSAPSTRAEARRDACTANAAATACTLPSPSLTGDAPSAAGSC